MNNGVNNGMYSASNFEAKFNTFYKHFLYYFNQSFPYQKYRPKSKTKCWVNADVIRSSGYLKDLFRLN